MDLTWAASLLVGAGVGAAATAIHFRKLLAVANLSSESWRTRFESEQAERAKFESQASRLAPLDAALKESRERLETLTGEKGELRAAAERVPALEERVVELLADLSSVTTTKAELETQVKEQATAHQDKLAALTTIRGNIESDFKALAADALVANQKSFLNLANQVFEKHKTGADTDLEAKRQAVEALISPLNDALASYKTQVEELERLRSQAYGALSTELRSVAETQNAVRAETSKLVQALRAAPKTRGRWGEHTLRNVLELSGLSPYCDFTSEETFQREDEVLRPDVIIRLPGDRHLVIDSKTSMSAYLDAVDALDDAERERCLVLHAAQLRTHMKGLAAKSYWDGLTVTPDFVVMFVPGENFYAAAVERDPSLFEDAAALRVIIVTPSTLIALAKAVAFGWRQEKVAENAKQVHALGRELYRRLVTMSEHIANCGQALSRSVQTFNQFVGSLEQSVMPQARRFNELEVEGTATAIESLEPVTVEPRLLRSDRDFAISETAGVGAPQLTK
jgi:DNA recombination protein RmuC